MLIEKATLFEAENGDKVIVTCGEKEDGSFKSADVSLVRKDGTESLVGAFELDAEHGFRMFAFDDENEFPVFTKKHYLTGEGK